MQNPVNLSSLGQFPVMMTEMQYVYVASPRDVSTLQKRFSGFFVNAPLPREPSGAIVILSKNVIITALFVFTASCIKQFLALSMHATSGRSCKQNIRWVDWQCRSHGGTNGNYRNTWCGKVPTFRQLPPEPSRK